MGRAHDKMNADPDLAALVGRAKASDSPSVLGADTIGMDLPLGREPKPGRGSIIEVHTCAPIPGRMAQALEEAAEVCEFVEANGAVNARLIQLTYAGPASGLVGYTWEHENWVDPTRAWGGLAPGAFGQADGRHRLTIRLRIGPGNSVLSAVRAGYRSSTRHWMSSSAVGA